ncbi:HIRAN domain-containing protein [Stenotrophomonas maltophilia]|uniref:HIRAN domain-containing protein n=1 Tax=Stenotrophomonas maltophilia TaxID=40324 RepID=UPI0020367049|nr:HIRAN domain-containing protein [Stenotrophomonas maltophilia]MCM2523041.1 HIRAN domain-containing protein [Stenotrophomonas maltophilia]
MATITVPIWKPVAEYAVKAALTSRFREELDEVANNRKGSTSRIFTLVVLYPDNTNTADQNAVAVMTQQAPPRMLGYLPREVAAEYRQRMAQAGYEHMVSACEAVLSGGLVTTDKVYDYILEVDLDMSIDPHPDHLVIHPEMVRHTADPEFKKDTDGAYRFKCWIPHDAVGHLHPKQRTKGWTTDSWTTVNYYLSNAQSIGLGFKVLSVPKSMHARVFGEEPVTAVVEEIKRRWVTLRLEK